MRLRLLCPHCDHWLQTDRVRSSGWNCPMCGFLISAAAPLQAGLEDLTTCHRCGNHELYIQKDFPHWLGMGILVVACAVSAVTYALYWIKTTWAILIGSALLDGFLYLIMGDVTVCYRCQTQYRGFRPNATHQPFDLAIGEKYRQERLRRQELKER
jgi:hypothetical protein